MSGGAAAPRPLRDRAIDGRKNFGGLSLEEYARPGRGLLGNLARRAGVVVPAVGAVATDAPPLPARLYRDQWIVDCPNPGCGSASYVWPEQPLFLCAECFNGEHGGLWLRVAVPSEGERAEIEEIVGHRPLPGQRNWVPGETVTDLRKENRDNGHHAPPARGVR